MREIRAPAVPVLSRCLASIAQERHSRRWHGNAVFNLLDLQAAFRADRGLRQAKLLEKTCRYFQLLEVTARPAGSKMRRMKTLDAIAIGTVAHELQALVEEVATVAKRLRLRPVMFLDRVPHYSGEQVEKIRRNLRRQKVRA